MMSSLSRRRATIAAVAVAVVFGGTVRAEETAATGAPAAAPGGSPGGPLTDVLDRPAIPSELAARKLLIGMARAGDKLVAVGPRGTIVVSSDGGQNWTQAKVPVSSDLTAAYFATPTHGWAVGQDGVVLVSTDAGATWTKQLDGRQVNTIIHDDIKAKLAANPESVDLQAMETESARSVEMGADKPFLDVWFEDENKGFVVGAYNLILATSDGGKSWQSWFDRVPNTQFMSLYSIRPAAGNVFISGEQGTFFRLDREAQKFVAVPVDYKGSLFGVLDAGDAVVTFGLKGNTFRSADAGATWTKVDSKLTGTIIGGATLGPRAVVLADQSGHIAESKDGGLTFEQVALPKTVPLSSVMDAGGGKLAFTGPFGVMVVAPGAAAAP